MHPNTRPVDALGEFGELPAEMIQARRWLVWKSIPQPEGKKPRKVPFYVDGTERHGKLDSPEDQARFATFEAAVAALETGAYAGLGFALGPDGTGAHWQGVDLDGITERPGLQVLMEIAPGYVERSPSGNGYHCIGHGQPFASLGSNQTGIEAYASGRYFTVTGDAIGGRLEDLSKFVVEKLRPIHKPRVETTDPPAGPDPDDRTQDLRAALWHLDADDYETWIRIGFALKTLGDRGRALWLDWSSTSEKFDAADAARRWDGFEPQSTDYRAIFAEAQRAGWINPKKARPRTPDTPSDPEDDEDVFGFSDDDLALAFVEAHPDLRYVDQWGKWMLWDGRVWRLDQTRGVFTRIRRLLRRDIAPHAEKSSTKTRLLSAKTVSAIETLARSDHRAAATVDQWDASLLTINTPRGVIDLQTGAVTPNDPKGYATRITSVGTGGTCPRWLRFLAEITARDDELIAFLRRVSGYAATGLIREHALFFLHGMGGNGKSVFLDTLVAILNDYAAVAPMETFIDAHGDRHPTELAMLRGKRLVVAQETEQGRAWAESKIKALTGGGKITARFMRQDFFEFEPQFTLLIAGNHKPRLRNVDEAIRRRFHLIPFSVTIQKEQRDTALLATLEREAAGILTWIVQGAREYFAQGLNPPPCVRDATEDYFSEEDSFAAWIADNCETSPTAWDTAGRLFGNWKVYAEAAGMRAGDQKAFAAKMEAAGFEKAKDGRRGRHWRGVALSREADQPPEDWASRCRGDTW